MLIPHLVGWRDIRLHELLHASFDLKEYPVEHARPGLRRSISGLRPGRFGHRWRDGLVVVVLQALRRGQQDPVKVWKVLYRCNQRRQCLCRVASSAGSRSLSTRTPGGCRSAAVPCTNARGQRQYMAGSRRPGCTRWHAVPRLPAPSLAAATTRRAAGPLLVPLRASLEAPPSEGGPDSVLAGLIHGRVLRIGGWLAQQRQ